ncbi:MAG: hypothetical protein Q7T03_08885 [Deltaproteobacteria bacterium]|nr:hypothetical protein [Deltaproteobacteria bacterium]
MRKIFSPLFFLLLLGVGRLSFGFPPEGEVPRKILAFYDPKMFSDVQYAPVHQFAAMPLNHLGLEVIYRSITDPLPDEKEMEGFRGVLTWFQRLSAVPDANAWCTWLTTQMQKGRKVVILGEPGIFPDKKRKMSPECKKTFKVLGAEYRGEFSDNPLFFKIIKKDSSMTEFERKLDLVEGLNYSLFQVRSPGSHVYLHMARTDREDSVSDLVFTTPKGGFAHATYVHLEKKEINKVQWRINPFRFFEEAFGMQGLPRPDTTTLNGRRIFYTHIDGDGIVNVSHIDWKSFSGEIIYNEIFRKYPDLPITASIIAGYLDMNEYKSDRVMTLYRNIFSLPNVEAASHGYAHPLIWRKKTVALKIPGYTFSNTKEIEGSVEMIQSLLDKDNIGKKVDIFLWTGDCVLSEDDIFKAYKIGVLNINGGDTRFDKKYDSYSSVSPLGILRGSYLQVYASNSNENVYTNLWEGPYYGFIDVIETFKNTEEPLRIKPIDIYYHYYSGERHAALKSLKAIYDYALTQKIFPMFAGDYSRIVGDFFKVKMESLNGGFRIVNEGQLKTIRFDHENRGVDLKRSRGILGFNHLQGNLYVALDDSSEHAIFLASSTTGKPYIVNATFQIKDFKEEKGGVRFSKKGWLKSEGLLGGMAPLQNYSVRSNGENVVVKSDAKGMLPLHFKQAENSGPATDVRVERL